MFDRIELKKVKLWIGKHETNLTEDFGEKKIKLKIIEKQD